MKKLLLPYFYFTIFSFLFSISWCATNFYFLTSNSYNDLTPCLMRYTLAGKMGEFDQARQRISVKEATFDSVKPLLSEMETSFLNQLPEKLVNILQDSKSELEKKTGLAINETVNFYFRYTQHENDSIRHRFVKEDEESNSSWREGKRYLENSVPVDGGYILDTYKFTFEDRKPELLIEQLLLNGNDWIKNNIFIKEAVIGYENNLAKIFFSICKDVISFKGSSGRYRRNFKIDDMNEIDSFTEELVVFIDKKQYLETKSENQENVQIDNNHNLTDVTGAQLQNTTKESDNSGVFANDIKQITEAQYQNMQIDERDRVLAEIERLESLDPKYQCPSWISDDEQSKGNIRGVLPSDRSQFSGDDSFNSALQNQFPRPRENG